MKTLPKAVISAVDKITSTFIDSYHPSIRAIRLFVLDWHEVFSSYLDRILVELIIAVLPVPRRRSPKPFAAHIEKQVMRMSFNTKLELIKPSFIAFPSLNVEALVGLSRLRNDFAHSSANVRTFHYRGNPLWRASTLRMLSDDVLELGLALDCYIDAIDQIKQRAAKRPVAMPRYAVLAGWSH